MKTSTVSPRRAAPPTFREHLRNELARRCAANDRYSLRAFARFLRIDHATLSQVLRGKRAITPAAVRRLAARLDLEATAVEGYCLEETTAKRRMSRESASDVDADAMRDITDHAVGTLTSWHDWAILELTRVSTFVADACWVSRVLDCTVDDVQLALHRLTSLGFLEMVAPDRWVDRTGQVETTEDYALATVERLAERLRDLSVRALRRSDGSLGMHSTTTFAVQAAAVPRLIARLNEARAEVTAAVEADSQRDAVYYLAISLFPITTPEQPDPL
jgi:uncharacterized protein (TIGR02147 family)